MEYQIQFNLLPKLNTIPCISTRATMLNEGRPLLNEGRPQGSPLQPDTLLNASYFTFNNAVAMWSPCDTIVLFNTYG